MKQLETNRLYPQIPKNAPLIQIGLRLAYYLGLTPFRITISPHEVTFQKSFMRTCICVISALSAICWILTEPRSATILNVKLDPTKYLSLGADLVDTYYKLVTLRILWINFHQLNKLPGIYRYTTDPINKKLQFFFYAYVCSTIFTAVFRWVNANLWAFQRPEAWWCDFINKGRYNLFFFEPISCSDGALEHKTSINTAVGIFALFGISSR